jgi:Amt family ammonium transporter
LFNGGGFASLQAQIIGTLAVGAFTFTLSFVAWSIIKTIFGLRVTPEDEVRGLDISEMGMEAYAQDPMPE